jgi:zinc protease
MSEPRILPCDCSEYDLPNGLRLVAAPTPYPNIVSLYIVVHAGSRNEVEEGRSGFAHFFEHMMFRGTPDYPPEKYEAVLQQAGASSNAFTDDDCTVYHTTMAREDFERILAMEADRFMNLDYPEDDFRTEALAVLGEYNKDSAEPANKLHEVLRDTAFDRHTYKHTTMGFLADIERMPGMYDYSRQFFDRFYRPEYTTLVVAGDIRPGEAASLVERHWGRWRRGSHLCEPPQEPPPAGPREAVIPWNVPTLPYLVIAYRSPAYSDSDPGCAALDIISHLGFSESSPLFHELVIERQLVDLFYASNPDHVDPYLFSVMARVKEPASLPLVRERILETFSSFAGAPVDAGRLEKVKRHLRYRFALSLDNTESVAETLSHYVSLKRTPETIARLYRLYASITPGDIQEAARRYFIEPGRTTVTLQFAGQGGEGAAA